MKVIQSAIGKFHHFHLARQLERHNLLGKIFTGYPRFKLKDEIGIPSSKIHTFPWLHAPYMASTGLGISRFKKLNRDWVWQAQETLDKHVAAHIDKPTVLIALSSSGLRSGKVTKKMGGKYICDRGSTHITFQNEILSDEYKRWGLKFDGIDDRIIQKEIEEYEVADFITVPSEFVKKSFIRNGVAEHKIKKIVYGARLERFYKSQESSRDIFRIIWVGTVSVRKGFLDLLLGFKSLNFKKKELVVVGPVSPDIIQLLQRQDLNNVVFKGRLPNTDLRNLYSSSHAFVLPSIEEGLAMVQGEALACGCPVIATANAGAEDLFENEKEGFIVPIRSPNAITDCLQRLADEKNLQYEMSNAAINRVNELGGWNKYGDDFANFLNKL